MQALLKAPSYPAIHMIHFRAPNTAQKLNFPHFDALTSMTALAIIFRHAPGRD